MTVPLCDVCDEDKATVYCSACAANLFLCDQCFPFAHKSTTKKAHAPIPINTYLATTMASSHEVIGPPPRSDKGLGKKRLQPYVSSPLWYNCESTSAQATTYEGKTEVTERVGDKLPQSGDAEPTIDEECVDGTTLTTAGWVAWLRRQAAHVMLQPRLALECEEVD
jgi:hypothetical protein